MFSHITVGTNNIDNAIIFYTALLSPLGMKQRQVVPDGGPVSACWIKPGNELPRFYLYSPFDRKLACVGNGSMVAFLASSEKEVNLSYQAGIQSGGSDEGKPGYRLHYGKDYYGAYLRDPDGNKIHVVYRGDIA